MSACRTLFLTSISSLAFNLRSEKLFSPVYTYNSPTLCFCPLLFTNQGLRLVQSRVPVRCCASAEGASVSIQTADLSDEGLSENQTLESQENLTQDTVENLLTHTNHVTQLMKMERRPIVSDEDEFVNRRQQNRWFPYLDSFKCGSLYLSSEEVLEAMGPHIMESRKERFRNVARYRSYSVCLVIEGLSDFGNVSAALRSADALGFQSVHVVSCDSSKRYKDNRHVSMGAEKWLDIELWNSAQECFKVLTCRGYRIATTHVGMDAVSIYEMDWSLPTAIVVGNENRGISDEALQLSDLHCSIPMKGMVDSFNVSVAAGILMHHAVYDRISRLGCHGDLTLEERQILLAEFSLRHSKSSISIANEYAKRKAAMLTPKL